MSGITARALEEQIFDKEEIRVVIRDAGTSSFSDYPYSNRASVNTSLSDWKEKRLRPIIGDLEAVIINGEGLIPHGLTSIEKVRKSYVTK